MNKLKISATILMAMFFLNVNAQNSSERVSPPKVETSLINGNKVTINYSSPAVKGRVIWGDLVPYNSVWRTGANEATNIVFEKDVKLNNQPVKAGIYSLFTLPTEDEWTVILNSEAKQWGAFNYNPSKDVIRFKVKPMKSEVHNESLVFKFEKNQIYLYWENLKLGFPIE